MYPRADEQQIKRLSSCRPGQLHPLYRQKIRPNIQKINCPFLRFAEKGSFAAETTIF